MFLGRYFVLEHGVVNLTGVLELRIMLQRLKMKCIRGIYCIVWLMKQIQSKIWAYIDKISSANQRNYIFHSSVLDFDILAVLESSISAGKPWQI